MAINAGNSFRTRDKLNVGAQTFDIHRLEFLEKTGCQRSGKAPVFAANSSGKSFADAKMAVSCTPRTFAALEVGAPAPWKKKSPSCRPRAAAGLSLACSRRRIFATMREAVRAVGGNPKRINPSSLPNWSSIIP